MSYLCLGVEKIFMGKTHSFSLYGLYGLTHPQPGVHDIYNFGKSFFDHHHYKLRLFDLCPDVEEMILKRKNAFSLFDLYDHAIAQEPLP